MTDQIVIAVGAVLGLIVLWFVLKAIFKLTVKVFTCGIILILVIGGIILVTSNVQIF
jgi:hypothetical protein